MSPSNRFARLTAAVFALSLAAGVAHAQQGPIRVRVLACRHVPSIGD